MNINQLYTPPSSTSVSVSAMPSTVLPIQLPFKLLIPNNNNNNINNININNNINTPTNNININTNINHNNLTSIISQNTVSSLSSVSSINSSFTDQSSTTIQSPISLSSPTTSLNSFKDDPPYSYSSIPNQPSLNSNLISNQSLILNPNHYKLIIDFENGYLGQGSISTVYSATLVNILQNNLLTQVAIKLPINERINKKFNSEALILNTLSNYYLSSQANNNNINNNNININNININFPFIKFFGIYQLFKKDYPPIRLNKFRNALLLEKCPLDLSNLIDNITFSPNYELFISNTSWWNLVNQLFKGLLILRKLNIIHCDLKTSNVLISNDTQLNFKITDFSSACFNDASLLNNPQTTLQFSAPELLSNPPSLPTFKSDLYSVGLILLHAAIGKEPYYDLLLSSNINSIQLINWIRKGNVLRLIDHDTYHKFFSNNKKAEYLLKLILQDRLDLFEIIQKMNFNFSYTI
ncbi:putative protein kinase ISR1 [Ascoidea rubescens DSM 1968]|uniref:mitogen-activated protein kinase kinase n=1 Tax=Ascoidea rubescens DSM 1968 TaxID=1344418 RepID=A0A1D2VS62_9ASCO|nr:kinase-like protein [Ascoidea rubescens DSM 1968]ODV64454.1 kinase-like protein [Ascoidea rubescens DSM 1968]